MREPVRRACGALCGAILAVGATACGGPSKPPMVPDAPDPAFTGDAGGDLPSVAPSPPPAPKR
jgi:hypothetical protein